jgi:hypothetical protein
MRLQTQVTMTMRELDRLKVIQRTFLLSQRVDI